MTSIPIAILGGGIAGLSTAAALTRLDARGVVLFERESALARQSTSRSACVVRSASDDPVLEEFALRSARALASPPADLGTHSFVSRSGLVLLGRGAQSPSGAWERRVALQSHARRLSPDDFARLVPLARAHGEEAWLFANEGVLDVDALIEALTRCARARGVELRCSARVSALRRDAKGFELEFADGRRERVERLILAAGGWSGTLGRALGSHVTLRPTRRHIFVTLRNPLVAADGPIVWNDRAGFYWRPERGGVLACACDTSDADPEEHGVDPRVESEWRTKLAQHIRGVALDALQAGWSGTRTFSSDERFVIGADRDVEGLFWVAGLGGHGMTCGLAAGDLAARIVLDHTPDAHFVAAFAPGRQLHEPHAVHASSDNLDRA